MQDTTNVKRECRIGETADIENGMNPIAVQQSRSWVATGHAGGHQRAVPA